MRIILLTVIALNILFGSVSAEQLITTNTQSPAIGNMNGDINYNKTTNVNTKIQNYIISNIAPVSSRLNSLDSKREALLVAENPTKVLTSGVKWVKLYGDKEPFLVVQLKNSSKLPATNLEVSLLDNSTGKTLISLKPYKLAKSYSLKILKGTPLGISAENEFEWPVASVSDIKRIMGSECVIDVGLDYILPTINPKLNGAESILSISAKKSKGFYYKVRYTTIFGEQISFISTLVIDVTSSESNMMILRGTDELVPKVCVGDRT